MNSPKQNTQRKMLGSNNVISSPRFAKLAARSPNGTVQQRQKQTRTTIGLQTSRDSESGRSLKKLPQIKDKIPERVTQNIEQGQIQFGNKDMYEGGMREGRLFGKGTYLFYGQSLEYNGQFYDDNLHGWGTIKKTHGSQPPIYEGNFEYGQRQGEGKYQYGPDHYYNGDWSYGMKQGKGIYHYSQGLYNGEWKQNKKNGQGSLKLKNGTQFKGTFLNDQFSKGLIRYHNSDEYSGQLRSGLRQGQGSYFNFKTQERYKGQWKNDQKHGRGTVYLQNGDQLQCTFLNGSVDQTQSCTYKWNTGPDEGATFNGWLKNGSPEKGHVTRDNGQEYDTY